MAVGHHGAGIAAARPGAHHARSGRHHVVRGDDRHAGRFDAHGVPGTDRRPLRAGRTGRHSRKLRGWRVSRVPRLRHRGTAARARDPRQVGDRRDGAAQLGIPPLPVPHGRPCRTRRPRPVPVRSRLPDPGAHRRKNLGLLHQRRWQATPDALYSDHRPRERARGPDSSAGTRALRGEGGADSRRRPSGADRPDPGERRSLLRAGTSRQRPRRRRHPAHRRRQAQECRDGAGRFRPPVTS